MRLSDFDYSLPKELIAQYPLTERDQARMLVVEKKSGRITHRVFKDIADYLNKDDLLVINDTKVLSCRLKGKRSSGGKVEVLLLKRKQGLKFSALIKPARLRINEKILFNGGKVSGTLSARGEITFKAKDQDAVYGLGAMPLPPYIKRDSEELDDIYYQTVYARNTGAIAAPTAGLHFTKESLQDLMSKGVELANITLHVGYGTFKPVKVDEITAHKMEPESFEVSREAQELIEAARKRSSRVFAVGTTSVRALESCARGRSEGETDLFIYPGFEFKLTDCLLTNFHLPRTTLFMLVCAFAGEELIKRAYQEAIDKKYRFYSYGDAMLII
ncbi:tRNA preQ1(34) S-adenosylmethionine ribosyltransferase-isomerase QueA [Candidatus Omnitrophota bacterium]